MKNTKLFIFVSIGLLTSVQNFSMWNKGREMFASFQQHAYKVLDRLVDSELEDSEEDLHDPHNVLASFEHVRKNSLSQESQLQEALKFADQGALAEQQQLKSQVAPTKVDDPEVPLISQQQDPVSKVFKSHAESRVSITGQEGLACILFAAGACWLAQQINKTDASKPNTNARKSKSKKHHSITDPLPDDVSVTPSRAHATFFSGPPSALKLEVLQGVSYPYEQRLSENLLRIQTDSQENLDELQDSATSQESLHDWDKLK